jgi:hypothetical protein
LTSRFRLILPTSTAVIAAVTPVQDASAQSDLAAIEPAGHPALPIRANDRSDCAGRKTVAIAKQRLGADNKVTGILLSQLGNLYRDTGRFADAENVLKTAAPCWPI